MQFDLRMLKCIAERKETSSSVQPARMCQWWMRERMQLQHWLACFTEINHCDGLDCQSGDWWGSKVDWNVEAQFEFKLHSNSIRLRFEIKGKCAEVNNQLFLSGILTAQLLWVRCSMPKLAQFGVKVGNVALPLLNIKQEPGETLTQLVLLPFAFVFARHWGLQHVIYLVQFFAKLNVKVFL